MRKIVYVAVLSFGLSGMLAGCAATPMKPSGTAAEPRMETPAEEAMQETMVEKSAGEEAMQEPKAEAPPAAQPAPPEDPCEAVFRDLAEKARSTMKIVYGTCQEKQIEANPMWSFHYDGTVRIRVLDAAGKVIEMQDRKP